MPPHNPFRFRARKLAARGVEKWIRHSVPVEDVIAALLKLPTVSKILRKSKKNHFFHLELQMKLINF